MAINDTLKPLEYYSKNKKKFNKKYNHIWKRIAGPEYIGMCSYLFHEFYKEWSANHNEYPVHNDFFRYYLSHTQKIEDRTEDIKNIGSKFYGRDISQLTRLADHYMKRCDDEKITLEECFDDIVNHAVIETFNGQMREIMLEDEYKECGFSVEKTDDYWDKNLGVDMIIKNKKGNIVDYIQCKPLSTFIGDKNRSLIQDRIIFFVKEREKEKECRKNSMPYFKTRFILYDNNYPGKWAKIGEKKSFYLEDLCTEGGMPTHTREDFCF